MNEDMRQSNRQKRSFSIILALAVISLLAGASVSTSVDDFVEPRYAEDSPYAGVIDDAVGDATWEELEKNEKANLNHFYPIKWTYLMKTEKCTYKKEWKEIEY
jgi:hypothetical protein